jgi:hypothetical protein
MILNFGQLQRHCDDPNLRSWKGEWIQDANFIGISERYPWHKRNQREYIQGFPAFSFILDANTLLLNWLKRSLHSKHSAKIGASDIATWPHLKEAHLHIASIPLCRATSLWALTWFLFLNGMFVKIVERKQSELTGKLKPRKDNFWTLRWEQNKLKA